MKFWQILSCKGLHWFFLLKAVGTNAWQSNVPSWKIQAHENTKISFKKSMDHRFLVVAYMAFCYLMTL